MSTFFEAVSESLKLIDNHSSFEFETLDCEGSVGYYAFLAYMLIPAVICVITFWIIVRRKSLWPDKMDGRPGVAYPMNILTRSQSLPFAACFGVIATLVFKIVSESKQAVDYNGPPWGSPFVSVLSVIIYGTTCFPIFTAVSLRQPVSDFLGSLYTWTFTAFLFVEHYACSMSLAARVTYSLQNGLQFLCITYLDAFLPYRFVQAARRRVRTGSWKEPKKYLSWNEMRSFYQCGRVRTLLKRRVEEKNTTEQSFCEKIKTFFQHWTYTWDKEFRYSSRILSIMWISFMVLYMTYIKSAWSFTKLTQQTNSVVGQTLDAIGWDDRASDTELRKDARTLLKVYYNITRPLWLLFMFCFTVAFVVGVISILYILTSYRNNLKALYRGDHAHISPRNVIGNIDIITGSLRYAGYQVGYIIWAFVIQTFCLLVAILLVVIIAAVLVEGYSSWLSPTLQYIGPWLGLFLLILLLQYLAAKYFFLEDYTQSVSIDNRRVLFVLSYYMFFYNVFVSIGSCLLRLGKSMGLGILLISRLDHSLLPRKFELGDTGFSRYSGFMHLECYHTHPCMQTFVLILAQRQRDTQRTLVGNPEMPPSGQSTGQYLLTIAMGLLGLNKSNQHVKPKTNQVGCVDEATKSRDTDSQFEGRPELILLRENTSALEKSKTLEPMTEADEDSPALQATHHVVGRSRRDPDRDNIRVQNISMTSTVDAEVEPPDGSGGITQWNDLRGSEFMRQYRRRQRAAFNWFLLYTLHYNPQLIIERKEFLHRKRCLNTISSKT